MNKEEVFLCPFCGAPYRELIPAGTVQVKCRYCGATVLVPPRLGGAIKRCLNHPETLAVGICNRCGESYCDRCLHVASTKKEKISNYYCTVCLEKNLKEWRKTLYFLIGFNLFWVIIGVVAVIAFRSPENIIPVLIIILSTILMIPILESYERTRYPAIYEKMKVSESEIVQKPQELYEQLLHVYTTFYGGGRQVLESKIESFMKQGLSREDAIIKLAEKEKLIKGEPS